MSISLNDHEQRIKNAELELPKIQTRIDGLVDNGHDWAVIDMRAINYVIPDKYVGYKFAVYQATAIPEYNGKKATMWTTYDGGDFKPTVNVERGTAFKISVSGNKMTFTGRFNDVSAHKVTFSVLKILFYK